MKEKGFLKSSIIVTLLTIISRFSGLFKEMIIASKYGSNFTSDIYVFTFSLTTLMTYCIGEAFNAMIVPGISRLVKKNDETKKKEFVNNILSFSIIIGLLLSIFGLIFSEHIINILGSGFKSYSYSEYILSIKLVRIIFVSFVFIAIQNVIISVLQAHNIYSSSAINTFIGNFISILYVFICGNKFQGTGLIFSIVIGYIIQTLINIPKFIRLGYNFKFSINLKYYKYIFKIIMPIIVGKSVYEINIMVDKALSSKVGQGALSYMNYSNKVNSLIYSLIAYSLILIIFTDISKLYTENLNVYKRVINISIKGINFITIPLSFFISKFSYSIIEILFQRGSFVSSDTEITARLLVLMNVGLTSLCLRELLTKCFYSINDTKTPMINGSIGVLINIILNFILYYFIGLSGIALATSISMIITTVVMIYIFNKIIDIEIGNILKETIKYIIISIVANFIVSKTYNIFSLNIIINLFINAMIYLIVYIVLSLVSKVDIYKELFELAKINKNDRRKNSV